MIKMPIPNILAATIIALSVISSVARAGDPARTPWEIASAGSGRVAVPKGWRKLDGLRPGLVLFRQGDGIGVPVVDETGAPLQIGMVVEPAPNAKSLEAEVEALAKEAGRDPRLDLKNRKVENIVVSGAPAVLTTSEFIKEKSRRSLQVKLVSQAPDGKFWIVSGFLVGGEGSLWPTAASALASWLRAHVTSLSWDEKGPDIEKLAAAYRDFGAR